MVFPQQSIFIAIKGQLANGHDFIPTLYALGVRSFVHSEAINQSLYPEASFVRTDNVIQLLQNYAQYHRSKFKIPILAITGSNGKTILKEWLFLLLEQDYVLAKSPKSYNSQIGVPLSVLGLDKKHELAIFEAGISKVGEMQKLQAIIQPSIGIFTNIGEAHASGFSGETQKIKEKLILFKTAKVVIYRIEHASIHQTIQASNYGFEHWSWGASEKASLPIYTTIKKQQTQISIFWKDSLRHLSIPFTNSAAIENCLHAIATLLYLGIDFESLEQRIQKLQDVPMRLEIKEGINNCQIIDDSYNSDLEGLKIALDFLNQKHEQSQNYSKTLILSDIPEAAAFHHYPLIAQLLKEHHIQKLLAIGPNLSQQKALFEAIPEHHFFESTDDFLNKMGQQLPFQQESILLKGARSFEFERIAQRLKKRIHGTVLEINLNAITNNLQVYKNQLFPNTKMMVMVKASAYGSGSYEIAQLLQYNHVNYLGVAYVDEGVALRQRGIQLPIMIMNTAVHEFEILCQYQLEPVLYSFSMLEQFVYYLKQINKKQAYPIHLEFDTGMHRLGFLPADLPQLLPLLEQSKNQLLIRGLFAHLAAADENLHDSFSLQQIKSFKELATKIEAHLGIQAIKHILNSAGISRFAEHQMDMVRLGIGLYGIDPNKQLLGLQNVLQLKTSIAQIKSYPVGETIGYSRKGKLSKVSRIAVLSIGYADGFLRHFGNGKIQVKIHGQWAPTIGNICMDMCFVDVSHILDAQEGDEVIIFDSIESIERLAEAMGTISYEILTNISERVPRVFFED